MRRGYSGPPWPLPCCHWQQMADHYADHYAVSAAEVAPKQSGTLSVVGDRDMDEPDDLAGPIIGTVAGIVVGIVAEVNHAVVVMDAMSGRFAP